MEHYPNALSPAPERQIRNLRISSALQSPIVIQDTSASDNQCFRRVKMSLISRYDFASEISYWTRIKSEVFLIRGVCGGKVCILEFALHYSFMIVCSCKRLRETHIHVHAMEILPALAVPFKFHLNVCDFAFSIRFYKIILRNVKSQPFAGNVCISTIRDIWSCRHRILNSIQYYYFLKVIGLPCAVLYTLPH